MQKELGLTPEQMQTIIQAFKLKSYYKAIVLDNKILVLETWKSKLSPFIVLNRVLDFNQANIENIQMKKRINLLQDMLNEAVENEYYEQAAQIRDMMPIVDEILN